MIGVSRFRNLGWVCCALVLLASWNRKESAVSPLPQRAYVWQRDWKKPVGDAIARSQNDLAGCVILACEIEWQNGRPHPVVPPVDWAAVRQVKGSFSPAIRVMPYSCSFSEDDETIRFLCETARHQLSIIRKAGVEPRELQLDFDCPQKKLAGYGKWVRAMRRAISPLPLVITTLPCWLDEPGFPGLVRDASSYVLQVHSVAAPPGGGPGVVCDPVLARSWTARASGIGVPFEISLPTYRTVAGYGADGRKIGAYSDSVRLAWPPGTTIREYATDLDAMAALVASWQACHPEHCSGLLWYRLPVDGDRQNCPWPAFRALTQGRPPVRSCEVEVNGQKRNEQSLSLADLSLVNTGETDDFSLTCITVKWDSPATLALAEPPAGWRTIHGDHQLTFLSALTSVRLLPGASRAMGWLRFDQPARIHVDVLPENR
ncbi:MAG: DUF3142 domain-containing protein [Luteolibacter sp.]